MKTSSKMLFFMLSVLSTMMILSSSNWMNMWVGLEINLMSFIPLMSESKNPFLSQSSMMYFLVQSLASSMMIMSIMTSKFTFMNVNKDSMNIVILVSMMMKVGMPPFHLWFPEIMNKMKWNMCFLMSTWQKVGPLYILSKVLENNKINTMIIAITAMIGAIHGLNQTSARKIISYSSINHISWLLMLMMTSKEFWAMYMMLYMLLMSITCMMMYKFNIIFINQMKTFSTKILDKILVVVMMMSMGGMPPFLGFLPKIMTMKTMINLNEMFIMLIMVISTIMTLSYYLKISESMNLILSNSQKWMKFPKSSMNMFMFMMSANIMFPTGMLLIFF
nr:NADH dehydrogenase subunit 2 [Mecomma ambulans]